MGEISRKVWTTVKIPPGVRDPAKKLPSKKEEVSLTLSAPNPKFESIERKKFLFENWRVSVEDEEQTLDKYKNNDKIFMEVKNF
jgi:hypothetical protein